MRIIHGIKFEPELVREYQHVIYQNIVRGMYSEAATIQFILFRLLTINCLFLIFAIIIYLFSLF